MSTGNSIFVKNKKKAIDGVSNLSEDEWGEI